MIRRVPVVLAAALACALTAFAAPAGAASAGKAPREMGGPQIVGAFNAERQRSGLPPVSENSDWSAACRAHDHYMALNNVMEHFEDPGRPGYTPQGDWAGHNAVLAAGDWATGGDPWDTAPIHLAQMMSPRLQTTGAAQVEGYNCLTTWPGYVPGGAGLPSDSLFSFPGSRTGVPYAETAAEFPTVPGAWVGLPEGATTGPYLYFYWMGAQGDPTIGDQCASTGADGSCVDPTPNVPGLVLTSATLTGPDGPVPARVVTQAAAAAAGYGGYTPAESGFLIPVRPLRPATTYTASATFDNAGQSSTPRSFTSGYSFDTAPLPPPPPASSLAVPASLRTNAHSVTVRVTPGAPPALVQIYVLLNGKQISASPFAVLPGSGTLTAKLSPAVLAKALARGKGHASLFVVVEVLNYDNRGETLRRSVPLRR